MKISVPFWPQVRQLGYPYLEAEPRELPHLKMQVGVPTRAGVQGGGSKGWGRGGGDRGPGFSIQSTLSSLPSQFPSAGLALRRGYHEQQSRPDARSHQVGV